MNYQQTIDYLYAHLPMFSRIGVAAYKEDLHNTIALCNALDNPQLKFRSIHIAGTNGKGSTSHMLAAILQQAGYKTGLYTSPHLRDFRERIRINGEWVNEAFVTGFVERTREITEQLKPSFFELTVAMAFEYFAQEKAEVAVIETGLGGRLDSTNIIHPVLSIITNIGYDHMNILGTTLEQIAFEKAGIIKPHTPVVVGEYGPETKAVFESRATQCQAPIHFASHEYEILNINPASRLTCEVKRTNHAATETYTLDLNGLYQAKNLRTVLCAVDLLRQKGFTIEDNTKHAALGNVKKLTGLYGRWEVIAENPMIILDVAHNEDGIRQVLEQLALTGRCENLHIVMGVVKDKELAGILAALPEGSRYYFTAAHIPRALPADELRSKAAEYGIAGDSFGDVNEAIESARRSAGPSGTILVFGSVFVVGEVAVEPGEKQQY